MKVAKTLKNLGGLAKLMMFGMPNNAVGSIDVTKRCNLRCEHCYFFAEEHKERELTLEEWMEKLEAMKAAGDPMLLCTWVGGEPLVRKKLIETRTQIFQTQHGRHQRHDGIARLDGRHVGHLDRRHGRSVRENACARHL